MKTSDMLPFDKNVQETKKYFDQFYQHILDNLHNLPTGNNNYKNILFFQTINLCKEVIYLIEKHQFLSVPIVLRTILESFLKLSDIVNNGNDGINRIISSDIAEKEKILKSGLVDPQDMPVTLADLQNGKNKYQSQIINGDKDFKLTHQAKNHSDDMHSAIMLYSKYSHSTLAMLQQLYTPNDNNLIFHPHISAEYKLQYLQTLQRIIHELKVIYNEHMAI